MKINWGTGIFIFYSVFVGGLVFQLFKSFQYDNSLVVENYYEQDINYQKKYDKIKNSQSLTEPLTIDYQSDNQLVAIQFPANIGETDGEILFYRANDKSKDVRITLEKENRDRLEIPIKDLAIGEWQVSVDWSANGKPFFDKKLITIK